MKIDVGSVLSFTYPRHNYTGLPPKRIERRLMVCKVTRREEMDPFALEINSLLRRGDVLYTGIDLDCGEERSFWDRSMRDVRPCEWIDGPHDVVLLDFDGSTPERVYSAQSADEALAWVKEWLRHKLDLIVGVVPRAA